MKRRIRILPGLYKLDGHKPVECYDFLEWAEWFENHEHRVVKKTNVGDALDVSTVFLGIDLRDPPSLFESMVFRFPGNTPLDEYTRRYRTWTKAVAGHDAIVEELRSQFRA